MNKQKGINLREHEVIELNKTGKVTVIRPVKGLDSLDIYNGEREYMFHGALVNRKEVWEVGIDYLNGDADIIKYIKCPYGVPGETRFVKETVSVNTFVWNDTHDKQPINYMADTLRDQVEDDKIIQANHMPQWASRFQIVCADVQVMKLHDIAEEIALATGIEQMEKYHNTCEFIEAVSYQSCNGVARNILQHDFYMANKQYLYDSNPWVWVCKYAK